MPVKKGQAKKANIRKGDGYECAVCGYRVIVDEACGPQKIGPRRTGTTAGPVKLH
jgi:hypothetical protein